MKSKILPENILKRMRPEDRPKGQLTIEDAGKKENARLEREEQRTFSNFLLLQENRGNLWYDWSATHKASTNRPGKLDFTVCITGGRTLHFEFKARGGHLSPDQEQTIDLLLSLGHRVYLVATAETAIGFLKTEMEKPGAVTS